MPEWVQGYHLNQKELDIESGIGASFEETEKQANLISGNWLFSGTKPIKPTLLTLGGFQGSGKTTTSEILANELGLLVISPDEIRHNLFTSGHQFSEEFPTLVNAIKFELIKRALHTGYSVLVDQASTPDRVKLTKEAMTNYQNYNFLSVLLSAPEDVLRKRVTERVEIAGRYTGKLHELEASMAKYKEKYGNPRNEDYNMVIDTTYNDPQDVVTLIRDQLLKPNNNF